MKSERPPGQNTYNIVTRVSLFVCHFEHHNWHETVEPFIDRLLFVNKWSGIQFKRRAQRMYIVFTHSENPICHTQRMNMMLLRISEFKYISLLVELSKWFPFRLNVAFRKARIHTHTHTCAKCTYTHVHLKKFFNRFCCECEWWRNWLDYFSYNFAHLFSWCYLTSAIRRLESILLHTYTGIHTRWRIWPNEEVEFWRHFLARYAACRRTG